MWIGEIGVRNYKRRKRCQTSRLGLTLLSCTAQCKSITSKRRIMSGVASLRDRFSLFMLVPVESFMRKVERSGRREGWSCKSVWRELVSCSGRERLEEEEVGWWVWDDLWERLCFC